MCYTQRRRPRVSCDAESESEKCISLGTAEVPMTKHARTFGLNAGKGRKGNLEACTVYTQRETNYDYYYSRWPDLIATEIEQKRAHAAKVSCWQVATENPPPPSLLTLTDQSCRTFFSRGARSCFMIVCCGIGTRSMNTVSIIVHSGCHQYQSAVYVICLSV